MDVEATESTETANYWSEELPESDQGLIRDGNLRLAALSIDGVET